MQLFTEANATVVVQERHAGIGDARIRRILDVVIMHLHEAVREIEPTHEEWAAAIAFLTRTGQISDDSRQEFILLSDVLGVSMLVDAIDHRRGGSGGTESTVLGPFHVAGVGHLPMGSTIAKDNRGEPMLVSGTVFGPDGAALANAQLDVWQTAPNGRYDVQDPQQPEHNLRGIFTTGTDGAFHFRTVRPSSYPIPDDGPVGDLLLAAGRHPFRPAHIHFIITAPGCRRLVTHLFLAGDPYLDSDAVFGVKESLVVVPRLMQAAKGDDAPEWEIRYDFHLARAR